MQWSLKINNSLLTDFKHVQRINRHIDQIKIQYSDSFKKESLLKKIPDSEIHLSIDKNDFLHLDTLLMKNKFKTIANTSHLNNK